jgi:hypothetical protein
MKTEMEKRKKTVFQITREFNNHDRHCGIWKEAHKDQNYHTRARTHKPIHIKHEDVKTKTIESHNLKEDQFFSFPANITTMTAAMEDEKRRCIKTKTITHTHTKTNSQEARTCKN